MKVRREGRRVVHFEQYRPCRRCRSLFGGWKSNRRSNSLVGAANQLMMLVRSCPWRTLSRLRVARSFGIGEPGELRDPRELQFCSHRAKSHQRVGESLSTYWMRSALDRLGGLGVNIQSQCVVIGGCSWNPAYKICFLNLVAFISADYIWYGLAAGEIFHIDGWWIDETMLLRILRKRSTFLRINAFMWCIFGDILHYLYVRFWYGFEIRVLSDFFFVFIYNIWSILNVLTCNFVTACH